MASSIIIIAKRNNWLESMGSKTHSNKENSRKCLIIQEGAMTDIGRKRELNEDNYLVAPEYGLYLVADGMGGHSAGEIASEMAVSAIADFIEKTNEDQEITWPFQRKEDYNDEANRLMVATKLANLHVWHRGQSNTKYHGMGTTIVAAFVTNNIVYIGHVGDSRVYRIRNRQIEQVTEDHSLLADHIRTHKLTPQEAANFPFKNVITRALGVEEDVEVDIQSHKLLDGDIYLLCSDGLSGLVKEDDIAEIVDANLDDLNLACKELIDKANHNGGMDNITVVLFRSRYVSAEEAKKIQDQATEMRHAYPRRPSNQWHFYEPHFSEPYQPLDLSEQDIIEAEPLDLASSAEDIAEKLRTGKICLEKKNYAEAIALFKQIQRIDPDHQEAKTLLAKSRRLQKESERRKRDENPALRAKTITQYLEKGKECLANQDWEGAEQYFMEVQKLDPQHEEAQALFAQTLFKIQEKNQKSRDPRRKKQEEALVKRELNRLQESEEKLRSDIEHVVGTPDQIVDDILALDESLEQDEILENIQQAESNFDEDATEDIPVVTPSETPLAETRSSVENVSEDRLAHERKLYESQISGTNAQQQKWQEQLIEAEEQDIFADTQESLAVSEDKSSLEISEVTLQDPSSQGIGEGQTLPTPIPVDLKVPIAATSNALEQDPEKTVPVDDRATLQVISPFVDEEGESASFDDIVSLDFKEKLTQVREHFKVGLKCMEEEEYERAIHHWKIVRTLDAQEQTRYHRNAKVLMKIASMKLRERTQPLLDQAKRHYQKGELYKAWMILKRVLDEYPDHKEARRYFNLTQENMVKIDKNPEV